MPFDRISPAMLRTMRIVTALSFLGLGGALAALAGLEARAAAAPMATTALAVFGVFLLNAGMMLGELITRVPRKIAINVPFVAMNFQVALTVGLVALGALALEGPAAVSPHLGALGAVGFASCLMFVMMTKLHWNFTENTGKALPKG